LQPKDFTSNLHVVYSPTNYRVPNSVVFLSSYIYDERSVYSQTLNLDSIQKQYLMDLLFENYQPANREYLYNFLYDNCSTRVRDIIEKSTNNQITWIAQPSTKSKYQGVERSCSGASYTVSIGCTSGTPLYAAESK